MSRKQISLTVGISNVSSAFTNWQDLQSVHIGRDSYLEGKSYFFLEKKPTPRTGHKKLKEECC